MPSPVALARCAGWQRSYPCLGRETVAMPMRCLTPIELDAVFKRTSMNLSSRLHFRVHARLLVAGLLSFLSKAPVISPASKMVTTASCVSFLLLQSALGRSNQLCYDTTVHMCSHCVAHVPTIIYMFDQTSFLSGPVSCEFPDVQEAEVPSQGRCCTRDTTTPDELIVSKCITVLQPVACEACGWYRDVHEHWSPRISQLYFGGRRAKAHQCVARRGRFRLSAASFV